MNTQRYFLKLCYDGTLYNGWQIQKNTPNTVQEIITNALRLLLNQEIELVGCGRTDTGVHASEYFAHFACTNFITNEKALVTKLNKLLPPQIAILNIMQVNNKAHARFDAISRSYNYFIHQHKNPFLINKSYYVYGNIDVDLMNKAAAMLFDYTDFSAFSKSNTQTKTNLCKITKAIWQQTESGLVFVIEADRFLRNMVRAIVGTTLMIGTNKMQLDEMKKIIESKNRSNAGFSVPACGLFLTNVNYPESIYDLEKE
jgi:tRNA pseudouridine38-40 synthase